MMPKWFLYFKIGLRVLSLILSIKDSYSKKFEMSRFLIMLEKNLFEELLLFLAQSFDNFAPFSNVS